MFTNYKNFQFISRDKISTISYVVKGTVVKITKYPFQKEKIETVKIYLNGLHWRFSADAEFVPDSVEKLIKIWEMENCRELSTVGSY